MSTTAILGIDLIEEGQSQKEVTMNDAINKLDYMAGLISISTTGGTTVLTENQYRSNTIRLTGTLASNAIIEIPVSMTKSTIFVVEVVLGAYSLTLRCGPSGVTTVTMVYSESAIVWCTGTSVFKHTISYTGGTAVASVGLSAPAIFSVSGSPVTTTGTLTFDWVAVAANKILSGPTSGGSATPTFRSLVADDIPGLPWSKITSGTPTTLSGYGITDSIALTTGWGANQIVYANGSGTLTGSTAFTWNGTTLVVTSSGALNVALASTGANASLLYFQGTAGNNDGIQWYRGGSIRWFLYESNDAESGSNAGSNLEIAAYSDGGSWLGTYLSINRAQGGLAVITTRGIASGTTAKSSYSFLSYTGTHNESQYAYGVQNDTGVVAYWLDSGRIMATAVSILDTAINSNGIKLRAQTESGSHGFQIRDMNAGVSRLEFNSSGVGSFAGLVRTPSIVIDANAAMSSSTPLCIQDTASDKGVLIKNAAGTAFTRLAFIGDNTYLDNAGGSLLFTLGGSGKLTVASSLVSTNQAFTADGLITGGAGATITGTVSATTGFTVNNNQSYKSKNGSGTAIDLFYLDSSNNFLFSASSGAYYDFSVNGTSAVRISAGRRLLIGSTTDDGSNILQVTGNVAMSGILGVGGLANSNYATIFGSSTTADRPALFGIVYTSGAASTNCGVYGNAYITSGTGYGYGVTGISSGPRAGGVNVGAYFDAAAAGSNYALITGSAFVGINNGSPVCQLDVVGAIQATKRISSGAVTLSDAATIALDASLGNHFKVTLGGNRTMGTPTNAVEGQKITIEFIQDGTGSRTITFPTASSGDFAFGTDITGVTLTTTASARDVVGCIYSSSKARWLIVSFTKGF